MEIGHVCRQGSLTSHFLIAYDHAPGLLVLSEGGEETGKTAGGQTGEAAVQLPELPGFGEARFTVACGPTRHNRMQLHLSS